MENELANTQSEATFRHPATEDGAAMWNMAKDSEVLDLNSSYYYLLWCRDFAQSSLMAVIDGQPAGFVIGYMRPDEPETLLIWQVAVGAGFQKRGLAAKMLDELAERTHADRLETTITADNGASNHLFQRFAERHEAECEREPLFTPGMYPDGHDTEYLYRIAPLGLDADLRTLNLASSNSKG
ncbi:diaminobutyrate acetyltransferase [Arthrobacter rhombi]|nr:diaminobutyrate acetyltransferase [Arthrobacter rhombi]